MAVASALITLGDGNWKMGEGVKAVGSKVTDIDEQTILEHYVCKCWRRLSSIGPKLTSALSRRRCERSSRYPEYGFPFQQTSRFWGNLPSKQRLLSQYLPR